MKSLRGYGFFVLLIAVILLVVLTNNFFSGINQESYSYTQFKNDMADKKIQDVTVRQNQEVPTGEIVVTTTEKDRKSFYAPDVNTVLTYLDTVNFSKVTVLNVETTPWYLELLPYVLGFVLIFLLFSMMSALK